MASKRPSKDLGMASKRPFKRPSKGLRMASIRS
jgi:hypothetical protein